MSRTATPDASPTDAVILAWARLVMAQQAVLGGVESDLRKAGFPPLGWYDVLLELHRAPEHRLRPVEIESRLLIAQHNVSRLIDRLERDDLVAREPCKEDGRGQVVALTAKGADLLRRMWPSYRAAIQRHMGSKLTTDDAAALAEILGRLLHAP
jgi:DNA-binding MarR family transcriptional regulator